jgi:3-oxoacyl-[acyl-carrier protein] reductase
MNFAGKIVLITGGSRGIGKAAAVAFAKYGAKVVYTYLNHEEEAKETFSALAGSGHLMVCSGISNEMESEKLVGLILEKYDRIDFLLNNAGIYLHHPLDKIDFEGWKDAWNKTLEVNLIGPANLTWFVARQMIKQGGGKIINISSRGAFRGEPEYPAYGASKAGLNSFSQSMARLLGPYNIYVYVIAPGFVETDMAAPFLEGPGGEAIRDQSPLKRAARPEEIVHAILMCASEGSEYMTGAVIDVNGASYLRT